MSNLDRKSIEPIALSMIGGSGVRALQQFVTRSTLDDAAVLGEYQRKLGKTITSGNGMLSVDGSGFVKKGKNSAGVSRQYCGEVGKTENCQAGVFCAYAGENGYGLVDRELYLPKDWYRDTHADLRKKCEILDDKHFQTKNKIALWLYIRRYANNTIKYFISNAPENMDISELHEAATLRWPIEQCFAECKSYLGMGHFEGRSYSGFLRHLLFVMIAHFFITSLWLELKKTAFQ